jgi:hypothetical protein
MNRPYHRWLIGGLITLNFSFNPFILTSALAQTNSEASSEESCLQAINTAESKILEGRENISLKTKIYNLSDESRNDYPPGRNRGMVFVLGAHFGVQTPPEGEAILNSPQLMRSIATQVTNGCSTISYVEFTAPYSDYYIPFGIINGSVERFQCSEDWNPRGGGLRPVDRWGYYTCL